MIDWDSFLFEDMNICGECNAKGERCEVCQGIERSAASYLRMLEAVKRINHAVEDAYETAKAEGETGEDLELLKEDLNFMKIAAVFLAYVGMQLYPDQGKEAGDDVSGAD